MKLIKDNEIVEKKSKFFGYLFECEKEDEVKEAIDYLKKQHKITISGKLPVEYFNDIWYSGKTSEESIMKGSEESWQQ